MSDFALASPRIRSDPCHAMSPVTNNVTANPTDNFLSITVDLLTHTALDTAAMLIAPGASAKASTREMSFAALPIAATRDRSQKLDRAGLPQVAIWMETAALSATRWQQARQRLPVQVGPWLI